jgi:glycine cleavage system H lipoate-binding protein/ABC-type phosphate transport system substrate-binding protein
MKTRAIFLIGLLLLNCYTAISKDSENTKSAAPAGTISLVASPDLYNLVARWASEFHRLNPAVNFNISKSSVGNDAGKSGLSSGLGFVTGDASAIMNSQPFWNIVVGRDVIVPVMNAKNPYINEICRKGVTAEEFSKLAETPDKQNWGLFAGNGQATPLHWYVTEDASIKSGMAEFLNGTRIKPTAYAVENVQEMIAMIQKDPNSFGFCKLIDITDPGNNSFTDQIKPVPIDKNGNGQIDFMEDIYSNPEDFSRGVWIGKYTKALTININAVSSSRPTNDAELAFLGWVVGDGQQFLNSSGFSELVYNERQTQADKLTTFKINPVSSEKDVYSIIKIVLLVLIAFAAIGFILEVMSKQLRSQIRKTVPANGSALSVFDENSLIIPKGVYFDKTHTWTFMEKDGTVKIGIDDFIQHITGPITRIEMKSEGEKIKKGEKLLTLIRKGKQLNIYSPVTGIITTHNQRLTTEPVLLNTSTYDEGWVYRIAPTNWILEIQFLSMAANYKLWIKDEFTRLKDFFSFALQANNVEYAHVALQDGGSIRDNILADLGPEIWEDFQSKFIDIKQ